MKYSTAQKLYSILSYDWASINYISTHTGMSTNHIWNLMKFIKSKKLVEESENPFNKISILYRLKPMGFNKFLREVNE